MLLPQFTKISAVVTDAVLTITLARPKVKNAMDLAMVDELTQVIGIANENAQIRVIVVQGSGGNFCAGGDIKDMTQAKAKRQQGQQDVYYQLNRTFGYLLCLIEQSPKVVIGVVEGCVLGGGFGLVCVCDYVIASQDCYFALPETTLGLVPAQIAPFVVKRIGLNKTREIALFAESLDASQALRLNLVNTVAENNAQCQQILDKKLEQLARCAPQATAKTKQLLINSENLSLVPLLDLAANQFAQAFEPSKMNKSYAGEAIEDEAVEGEAIEGISAFIEKRPPVWALPLARTPEESAL